MKKQFILYSLIISSCLLFSCNNEDKILYDDIPVVEAYLYTNQPLDSIRIVKTLPYFSDIDANINVNDLNVIISVNNESYTFKQSAENPDYYIIGNNQLIIQENIEYSVRFDFNDIEISASTIAPGKAENFAISKTEIYIDDDSFDEEGIEFTWDNSDEEYYMLSVQLTDTTSLADNQIFDNAEDPPHSILMPPMNSNNMEINSRMIQYFGNYRAVLFKVNNEYIEIFESLNQSSSNLLDYPTNIKNGKGIFTALSSDTLLFNVIEN
ncbi:MAG: hypothetical protein KAR57_01165 [Bacteroidales bacterium]|nr:hypothetical protein [Bacteroidales bacterium]